MEVLVVDDEIISRKIISHTLAEAGYQVTTACDGQEALQLLRGGTCQLVVSDWVMPKMSGIELCREIRRTDIGRYIYLIMLTGHNRQQDAVEGLGAGADDFVTKPFNPAELIMRANTGRRIIGLETRGLAVFALAKLAESRDPETGAHLDRVRSYCRALARYLRDNPRFAQKVDDEYVHLIYETSPLHDIGKVGIPDAILLKPGKLTESEFDVMKTHTTLGAQTLEAALEVFPNARFLKMARDIALYHHEKFNGAGYPQGLKGKEIPLCGRIVALADAYDAITSKRVYKNAIDHDRAREILIKDSGVHFDPDIVDAFLAVERDFIAIRQQFAEQSESASRESAVSSPPVEQSIPSSMLSHEKTVSESPLGEEISA